MSEYNFVNEHIQCQPILFKVSFVLNAAGNQAIEISETLCNYNQSNSLSLEITFCCENRSLFRQ